MSLPFLNPKKIASVVMATRKSDGSTVVDKEEGEPMPELMSAAEDLLSGIAMKDAKKVAEALQAAIDMAGSREEVEEEMGE